MRNKEKDMIEVAEKHERILKAGFRIFSEKTIESVTMNDVAKAAGVGIATIYRYYKTKPLLVLAVSTYVFEKYTETVFPKLQELRKNPFTAVREYEFFLDVFLDLYRDHKDILRFNQFFNVYVQNEKLESETMKPFLDMIGKFSSLFHDVYLKAQEDHTMRTDYPEQMIFAGSLHLMLAVVTRYAVGLVYIPKDSLIPEDEIILLKEMLLKKYSAKSDV